MNRFFDNEQNSSNIAIKYISPKRVVLNKDSVNEKQLLSDNPRQPTLISDEYCVVKKGGYVIFDFGVEFAGGVDMTVQLGKDVQSAKLHVVFGESVSEAMSEIVNKNSGNYHSVRDTVIDVVQYSSFSFGNSGLRFVKIEALDEDIGIRSLRGCVHTKNITLRGSFECSDELLNKIWQTAVYTVYLNMQDYIYDGIKRDRLVWVGDMYPEVKTIMSAFGDDESMRKTLDYARDEYFDLIWMNKIPSYTFWWIKIHRDYYYQTGDIDYLKEQTDFLYRAVDEIVANISQDGKLSFDKLFTDWSTCGTECMESAFRSCAIIGMEAAAEIFDIINDKDYADKCTETIVYLKKIIFPYSKSKQASGIGVVSGYLDCESVNRDVLSVNPLEGLSTFYGYFVLIAKAMAKDMSGAIEIIKGYWGEMLRMGATTFWEDFDVEWTKNASPITEPVPCGKDDLHGDFGRFCYEGFRHSLCHGWSGGPAPFMTEYILGVKIIEPGCKVIKIQPMLGGLSYAKGTVPTPYGDVKVSHTMVDGDIQTEVIAPDEIKVIM